MKLELFCCSGGMAEGARRAGLAFDFAFDWSPDACDSYERNLGHRPAQMDVRDLVRLARGGWRPEKEIELLVADPPCTPWSRAGKREGLADGRDCLRETAELVSLWRPRAYLIGNVPGLDDATSWHVVEEVIGGLARFGYCTADYAQLDAADYGVPQHRFRPFWFGHLGGRCIRWPSPTHTDPLSAAHPTLPGQDGLRPWVTCRDALSHLPIDELGRPVRLRWKDYKTNKSQDGSGGGGGTLLVNKKHPINQVDEPSYAVTTKGDRGAQGACALEWPWDLPATTVQRDARLAPPGHHDRWSIMSHPNAVILSEKARAILQGFPESWHFAGKTKKARSEQIGMAMPPGLAEALFRSVRRQMDGA